MRHLHFVVVSLVDDQFIQQQTIMATVLLLGCQRISQLEYVILRTLKFKICFWHVFLKEIIIYMVYSFKT